MNLLHLSSQFTRTRSLVLMGLLFLSFMFYVSSFVRPRLHAKALDSELGGYSSNTVHERMEQMGEDGRRAYYTYLSLPDTLFAIFYSVFESAWLVRLYGTTRKSPTSDTIVKFIVLSPYIGGVSDIGENLFTFSFAFFYPSSFPSWATSLSSTFTILKYSFLFSSVVFILLGILKSLFFGTRHHSHQQ